MYKNLDEYLSGYLPLDYWYDEGFSIAREMLSGFSNQDWSELSNNIQHKSSDWKQKLAYCLNDDKNPNELNVLLSLINTDDEELLEICVDSLRGFINSENVFQVDESVIHYIQQKMLKCKAPTQLIFKDFLKKIDATK